MEREFPKNVKQIGNVCDEPKIYVEDYVDTYLNQLKEGAGEEPVAAVLTGEILNMDGQDVVYVAGALKLQDVHVEGVELTFGEEGWAQFEEEKQTFFSGQDVVGWCLILAGQPMGYRRSIDRIHETYFEKENTVFVWRDALDTEEIFYANKFGELMQMGGHYIFYEKNPSMQSYMISMRKKIGVTPSEMVADRAAKDFRSTIKEKMERKEQRQNSRFAYAMSVALVLVVLVIGVSTMNNYDRMEKVQSSLETLSQTVNKTRKDDDSERVMQQSAKVEEPSDNEKSQEAEETEGLGDDEEAQEVLGEVADATSGSDLEDGAIDEEKVQAQTIYQDEESAESTSETSQLIPGSGNYYTVKEGDTLDGISRKLYGSREYVEEICRVNELSDGNLIIIGQKLLLP